MTVDHPRTQCASCPFLNGCPGKCGWQPNAAATNCEAMNPIEETPYPYLHSRHNHRPNPDRACPDGSFGNLGSAPSWRGASRPNLQNRPVPGPHRRPGKPPLGTDVVVRRRPRCERLLRFAAGEPRHENGDRWQGLADERQDSAALGRDVCERSVRVYLSRLGGLDASGLVVST